LGKEGDCDTRFGLEATEKSLFSISYLEFADNEILPSGLYECSIDKGVQSMPVARRHKPELPIVCGISSRPVKINRRPQSDDA